MNKKDLRLDKFFIGRPKKMRNRPDNWSTKRLTKTPWTGLEPYQKIPETEQIFFWSTKKKFGRPKQILVYQKSLVHVVLVSLLVDQLSGLFLVFFGRPKKDLSSLRSFLFTLLNFLSSLFLEMWF